MLDRREFLAASAAAVGAAAPSTVSAAGEPPEKTHAGAPEAMSIRAYLCREARRITDRALSDCRTVAAWKRTHSRRRQDFLEMMGLHDLPPEARGPVPVHVTGTLQRPGYRVEKVHYESLPGLHVTANLYVPDEPAGRRAAVLYVCGHAANQKVHYQAHPRRFAQLGFVVLIVETVQLGEAPGFHHGCYREGWFHWYSRGYSPAAIELLNGMRGLDLLAARPDVDPERMGVTGISGGGASSWWIAAGDERVACAAPVCGTATLASHVADRVIDGHCDCMWWVNSRQWDLADVGGLIAPRPLLIASANRDGIFTIESIREVHRQLVPLYAALHAPDRLRLVETPGPHSYHPKSRTEIFSWFARHLQGRDVPPESIGDLDEGGLEPPEALRVYTAGAPKPNRGATIQDEFVPVAAPPAIASREELDEHRRKVVAALRRTAFAHFPARPPKLDARMEFEYEDAGGGGRFAYTSEEGWRLHGTLTGSGGRDERRPVLVGLRSPGERWRATEEFLGQMPGRWARVVLEPRGTGDTAWGEELNWHLRRAAAWTGRTLASLRVWDTLRGLEAVRGLDVVDGARIVLAARGEMAAVALYAALLDGRLRSVVLDSPPATQNAPSQPDGRGPAIEMLHCLRFTDLPQVAGMLYPAEVVLAGPRPSSYDWAADLYQRLGPPGTFRRLPSVSAWG